jgi:sporulation protein YlmC with PRC-barrel domain
MKKLTLMLAVGFAICAFVALQLAVAQQSRPMSQNQTSQPLASQARAENSQKSEMNTDRVSQIIGKTIVDSQNQKVGQVEDLLMDSGHCVGYVILSHGGLLGIGEKYVPIPWSQFASEGGKVRVDSSGDIVVNIPKAKLENAPNFAKSDWKDANSGELRQKIDQYYAQGGMQKSTEGNYKAPATSGEQNMSPGTSPMKEQKRSGEKEKTR